MCLRHFVFAALYLSKALLSAQEMDKPENSGIKEILSSVTKDSQELELLLASVRSKVGTNNTDAVELATTYARIKDIKVSDSPGLVKNSVAIALVIDVSPSMKDAPRNGAKPKIESAVESANEILLQLRNIKKKSPEKLIQVGVYSFSGADTFRTVKEMKEVTDRYERIDRLEIGNSTAIGDALVRAKLELSKTQAEKRNIIIVTDGENYDGIQPVSAIRAFNMLQSITEFPAVHFVAFDISGNVFSNLNTFLSKIYEAGNQDQLESVLTNVMKGILLEDEIGL